MLLLFAAGLGLGVTYGDRHRRCRAGARLAGAALAFVPPCGCWLAWRSCCSGSPRAVAVAWAVFGLFVVIGFLGELLQLPSWVMDLSPFQHVPAMPAEGFTSVPLVALTIVAAAVVGAGMAAFRRRDAGY